MATRNASAAPPVLRNSDLDSETVRQARVDLAACFRMAARLGMHEGICNHFSFVVPGRDDLFLVNPYGWAFSEITASRLLICDFQGNVVAGEGVPEATAFYNSFNENATLQTVSFNGVNVLAGGKRSVVA